jgi:hypothetical protein
MAAPRVILPLFCLAALCLGLWASAGNATESPLPLGPAALPPRATFTPTDTATRTPGTDPDQIAGYVYNTAHAPLKNVALTLTCPGAG